MTVATTNNRKDYTGNNSTDTYAFDFPIFEDTDLEVYEDAVLLTLTTDYTVTLDGAAPNTGTITLVAGNLGSGVALALVRNVPATQGVDLVTNDAFPPDTVEAELDRLTMLAQQSIEANARSLKLAPSSTESDVAIANLADNAGKFAQVNATEDGVEWVDSDPAIVAALSDLLTVDDSRTNDVAVIATHEATTSGTPAAGIGTGEKFRAESADEEPCDIGQIEFALSDVTAGSEDSYFQVLLRVAGAALAAAYRFVATTAFKAIITQANTADRTYTLPDASGALAMVTLTQAVGDGGGNYTRTTATYADVDATNLTHTVTIPTGWKALVTFNCFGNQSTTGTGGLAIADGGTVIRERDIGGGAGNAAHSVIVLIAGDDAVHVITAQSKGNGTNPFTIGNSSVTNAPVLTVLLTPSN